jgi:hypothetical protein
LQSAIEFDLANDHNRMPMYSLEQKHVAIPTKLLAPSAWIDQYNAAPPGSNKTFELTPAFRVVDWTKRTRALDFRFTHRILLGQLEPVEFKGITVPIRMLHAKIQSCHAPDCTTRKDAIGIQRPHFVFVHSIHLVQASMNGTMQHSEPWTISLESKELAAPRKHLQPEVAPKTITKKWSNLQPIRMELSADGHLTSSPDVLVYPNDPSPLTMKVYQTARNDMRRLEFYHMLLHQWPSYVRIAPTDHNEICVQHPCRDPSTFLLPAPNPLSYAMFRMGRGAVGEDLHRRTRPYDNQSYLAWQRKDFETHLDSIAAHVFGDDHSLLGTIPDEPLKLVIAPLHLDRWRQAASLVKASGRAHDATIAVQVSLRLRMEVVII